MMLNWNFIKGVGETKISSVRGMNISTIDKHNVNSNNASPQVLLLVKGDKQEEWGL